MYTPHGLGRYEFRDGKSSKFWECLLAIDGTYLVRWGRIGAPNGQSQTGLDAWTIEERVREKRQKGYCYIPGSPTSMVERERRLLEAGIAPSASEGILPAAPRRRL
jgi:predicted DNA-binding WGR domain protein